MSVNNFLTHDQGLLELTDGTTSWDNVTNVAAVLVTTSHTPDRSADTQYSHVSGNLASGVSAVAVTGRTVAIASTKIRFDCNIVSFGSNVTTAGRYIYFIIGNAASLNASDRIVGHVSLSGSGNVSSTNSVFSWDPPTEGLFEIIRSAAP